MTVFSRGILNFLAIWVAGLIVAAPLFGLDCEIACAGVTRGGVSSPHESQSEHCASHQDSGPGGRAGAPATPGRCSHHGDSTAVKKAVEALGQRYTTSIVAALPGSPPSPADPHFSLAGWQRPGEALRSLARLSQVLRL